MTSAALLLLCVTASACQRAKPESAEFVPAKASVDPAAARPGGAVSQEQREPKQRQKVELPPELVRRLEARSGGVSSRLHGVRLEWEFEPSAPTRTTDGESGSRPASRPSSRRGPSESDETPLPHVRIDLEYPQRMRAEFRERARGRPTKIWILDGEDCWLCSPSGGYTKVSGNEATEMLRLFDLAATLVHWDLLAAKSCDAGDDVWTIRAQLGPRSLGVQRPRATEPEDRSWRVGTESFELRGKEFPKDAEIVNEHGTRRLRRLDTGLRFVGTRFEPEQVGKSIVRTVRPGEKQPPNLKSPQLERQEAAYFLELDDPGDWNQRLAALNRIGFALHALGQGPAGLPVYTSTGKMRVFFRPDAGKKAAAPEGYELQRRERCTVAVLHAKGDWKQAEKKIARRLLAYLRRIGKKPAGPLLSRAFVLPGDPAPEPGKALMLRGELRLRD